MRARKIQVKSDVFQQLLNEIDGIKRRGEIEDSIKRFGLSMLPTFNFFVENGVLERMNGFGLWRCVSTAHNAEELTTKYYEKSCI